MTFVDLESEIVSEILISGTNGHNLDKIEGQLCNGTMISAVLLACLRH